MNRKEQLIQDILSSNNKEPIEFQLNNLDWVEVLEGEDRIELENEHGTILQLEDLKVSELEILGTLLGIEERFDYVIATEDNEWVSFGSFETISNINSELKELKDKYPCKLVCYYAKELKTL